MRWLRRDEDKGYEPLLATIRNAMVLSGRSKRNFTRAQLSFLITHLEDSSSFHNIIDLVLTRMGMGALLLAGLETIRVTEKSIGFEDTVFFHLLRGKLHRIRELFEVVHERLPTIQSAFEVDTTTARPACKRTGNLLS